MYNSFLFRESNLFLTGSQLPCSKTHSRAGWTSADYLELIWNESSSDASGEDRMKRSLIICWQIWCFRNEERNNKQIYNPEQLDNKIQRYCDELLTNHNTHLPLARRVSAVDDDPQMLLWIPAPKGVWKLNSDACWREDLNCGGIGWIIRDDKGQPVRAGCKKVDKKWKISWLEAWAICEGLKSIPVEAPALRIESDAREVVKLLRDEDEDWSEISNFIKEAKALILSKKIEKIVQVSRGHNRMAHQLPKKSSVFNLSKS